eukprot:1333678-Pyramimonas_sp.AAC.2
MGRACTVRLRPLTADARKIKDNIDAVCAIYSGFFNLKDGTEVYPGAWRQIVSAFVKELPKKGLQDSETSQPAACNFVYYNMYSEKESDVPCRRAASLLQVRSQACGTDFFYDGNSERSQPLRCQAEGELRQAPYVSLRLIVSAMLSTQKMVAKE